MLDLNQPNIEYHSTRANPEISFWAFILVHATNSNADFFPFAHHSENHLNTQCGGSKKYHQSIDLFF